jgi:hypothetical protein
MQQAEKAAAEKEAQLRREKAEALAKDMTDEKAAVMIQRLYRTRAARRMIKALIGKVYDKLYDPVSQSYYYFNNKTGESQWVKPQQLGEEDLILTSPDAAKKSPREQEATKLGTPRPARMASDMDDLAAALVIQKAIRAKKARAQIRDMVKNVFEKLYDAESGVYYYYNNKTGESQWVKPKTLGSEDLSVGSQAQSDTKKSPRRQAEDATAQREKLARIAADDVVAAAYIQKAFRAKRARARLRGMLGNVFDKLYDAESGVYYYYNNKTGESQWVKPKLLGSADLDVASPDAAKESPRAVARREEEAAIKQRQEEDRLQAEAVKKRRGRRRREGRKRKSKLVAKRKTVSSRRRRRGRWRRNGSTWRTRRNVRRKSGGGRTRRRNASGRRRPCGCSLPRWRHERRRRSRTRTPPPMPHSRKGRKKSCSSNWQTWSAKRSGRRRRKRSEPRRTVFASNGRRSPNARKKNWPR